MPELPDVEVFRRYVDDHALRQRVENVVVGDDDVLEGVSRRRLKSTLERRRLDSTTRHGKYLFVRLDPDGACLVLHFGMTGFLHHADSPDDELPRHTRVRFEFERGFRLAYVCQRKLGRVLLADDQASFVAKRGLGPDALDEDFDDERLREAIAGRSAAIKTTLMNQNVLAGVGNVYSDEILFHARIEPRTPARELDDKAIRAVHRAIGHVLGIAIDRGARVEAFPKSWLLPNREKDCPRCGGEIRSQKISGRTAHFCPRCQRTP